MVKRVLHYNAGPSEPALANVKLAALFGAFFHNDLRLFLRPDEKDRFSFSDHFADDLGSGADLLERFSEIDNINPVARFKNEPFHLRVPATRLVTEMGARFEQLLDCYRWIVLPFVLLCCSQNCLKFF